MSDETTKTAPGMTQRDMIIKMYHFLFGNGEKGLDEKQRENARQIKELIGGLESLKGTVDLLATTASEEYAKIRGEIVTAVETHVVAEAAKVRARWSVVQKIVVAASGTALGGVVLALALGWLQIGG